MDNLLITNILIIDAGSEWNGSRADIEIGNGVISRILEPNSGPADVHLSTIDGSELWCSPGWVDIGVQVCDPGMEHREDLASVTRAAAKGGFTAIGCQPNTEPALHSKSELLYLRNEASRFPVDCLPVAAVSRDCIGSDLAELYDLHTAGAVAFSNGARPIADSGLMLRALQYVKSFGSKVMNQPLDWSVCKGGQVHEGIISTAMGIRGIPSMAEVMMVERDLRLAAYTGSRLHISNISCARSVELIRSAKSQGLDVTSSVALLNLVYTDEAVGDFDATFKVLPPLREAADQKALIEGVQDGTIDAISANHVPWDEESVKKEFPYAEFGVSGLETLFALYQTELIDQIPPEMFVDKLAHGPRKVLDQQALHIEPGQRADLSIVRPAARWTCTEASFASKSCHSPLLGKSLSGAVEGIVKGGQWIPAEVPRK